MTEEDVMNYNAHARLRTILIVGLLAALCLAGCGQSYADEGQMKAFAANSAHGRRSCTPTASGLSFRAALSFTRRTDVMWS